MFFLDFSDLGSLGQFGGQIRAREVFKNLPGGRSFVLTEYEPVASHGDPVHDNFYRFRIQMLFPKC